MFFAEHHTYRPQTGQFWVQKVASNLSPQNGCTSFVVFCLFAFVARCRARIPLSCEANRLLAPFFLKTFQDNHRGPKLKISSISSGFPVTIFRNRVLARGFCDENNSHARWRSFFCCFFRCPPRRGLKICWVFQ